MKRFIQRWLGIIELYKEIREYFNDIRVINHLMNTLDTRLNTVEDKLEILNAKNYKAFKDVANDIHNIETKIDEDVSAEVQALNKNREYLKSVLSEDSDDK